MALHIICVWHLIVEVSVKSPSLDCAKMKPKRQHELNLCFQKNVLNKGKSAIRPLFKSLGVMSSASNKDFSLNSNLEDTGIYLPDFSSRTTLKLHNIFVTLKMVKKVIAILY